MPVLMVNNVRPTDLDIEISLLGKLTAAHLRAQCSGFSVLKAFPYPAQISRLTTCCLYTLARAFADFACVTQTTTQSMIRSLASVILFPLLLPH